MIRSTSTRIRNYVENKKWEFLRIERKNTCNTMRKCRIIPALMSWILGNWIYHGSFWRWVIKLSGLKCWAPPKSFLVLSMRTYLLKRYTYLFYVTRARCILINYLMKEPLALHHWTNWNLFLHTIQVWIQPKSKRALTKNLFLRIFIQYNNLYLYYL